LIKKNPIRISLNALKNFGKKKSIYSACDIFLTTKTTIFSE
jgi:hypothetical protein